MNKWRKRGKKHEQGDWVMVCPEPLRKNQKEQKFCWIAHPDRPGKGGPEVACRAAYVALMQGRLFDIQGDFSKKSAEKEEALAKDAADWPPLKFPNGKTQPNKPMDDSDDEDEELVHWGTPVVFAIRYKSEIYTGDTLTDGASLNANIKMSWSRLKDDLVKAFGMQAKFHQKQMNEAQLADGKKIFLDKSKAYKESLK